MSCRCGKLICVQVFRAIAFANLTSSRALTSNYLQKNVLHPNCVAQLVLLRRMSSINFVFHSYSKHKQTIVGNLVSFSHVCLRDPLKWHRAVQIGCRPLLVVTHAWRSIFWSLSASTFLIYALEVSCYIAISKIMIVHGEIVIPHTAHLRLAYCR